MPAKVHDVQKALWCPGDFNVSNAVCCFACFVAAGIFRIPRCQRVDPPAIDNSGDLLSGTSVQGSQLGLKIRDDVKPSTRISYIHSSISHLLVMPAGLKKDGRAR
jgi:hypothetical protein